jgi:hypothetical protein
MKKWIVLLLLAVSSNASAVIVQDKNGDWWDCSWITDSAGASRLYCVPLDHQPPDPNP